MTFGDVSTPGQNGFKKTEVILIRICFCSSIRSVTVKILFKLMQQVVLNPSSTNPTKWSNTLKQLVNTWTLKTLHGLFSKV